LAQELGNGRILGFAYMHLGHALYGLGQFDEAASAYHQALTLHYEMGQGHLTMESLAGMARIELAQGKLPKALAHVETILNYLRHRALSGTSDIFRIYWTCYQVLSTSNDSRAAEILQSAHKRLQTLAASVPEGTIRHSFLENVIVHRLIIDAWSQQQAKSEN
jgi:tetratricopeptide (TPR) repeat protein